MLPGIVQLVRVVQHVWVCWLCILCCCLPSVCCADLWAVRRLTSSGALAAVATISGVVFLLALAAESAPAASSFRTNTRLPGPALALRHTLLMSPAEPVASVLQQQGAGQRRAAADRRCQQGAVMTLAACRSRAVVGVGVGVLT